MLTLRPYQLKLIEQIRDQLRAGRSSILAVGPTGMGKTALAAHMISNATAKGKRVWFTCHRRELVLQSLETLEDSAGVHCGVIAAGFGANGYHLTQVASIQTLIRRWRKYPLPDLIIVDEAAHTASHSWSTLLSELRAANPSVKVIGLTATPQRLDGRGLGQWFEVIVEGPTTASLIDQGYLAKYRMWGAAMPDLTGVRTVAGDYNKAEMDAVLSRTAVVGDALQEYKKHCDGKRALMFMWSIKASEELAKRFRDAGIPAMHVDGETPPALRDHAMAQFRSGEIKVLSNVEIFGEGVDVPAVEAGFLLRPTQSLAMYLQQVGRILRPCEGKDAALIFDHAGMSVTHGYPDEPRTWTLDGETKTGKKRATPVKQCKRCYAVVPLGQKACKWCQTVFEIKPREVEQQEGELRELSAEELQRRAARREQGMASTYEALLRIEKQRGYKPGWARIIWNAKRSRRVAAKPRDGSGTNTATSMKDRFGVKSLFELSSAFRPKK